MPLALLIIGVVLIVVAFRGTYGDLGNLLVQDFTGSNGFLVWVAVLSIIGLIGYIRPLQAISRAFIGLVLLVLFLTQGGFWDKFKTAVQGATATPVPTSTEPQFKGPLPVQITGGGSGGSSGGIGDAVGTVAKLAGGFL